jgi:hypothetical protein
VKARQEIIRNWWELNPSTRHKAVVDFAIMELGLKPDQLCGEKFHNFGGLIGLFRKMLRKNETRALKAEEDFWRAWAALEEVSEDKLKGNNRKITKRKTTGFRNPTGQGRL